MKTVVKTLLTSSVLMTGLMAMSVANADNKPSFYAGAGLSQVTAQNYYDGDASDPKLMLLSVDAGVQFNRYLATELRVGTGVSHADHSWSDTDKSTVSQKLTFGVYVKGILPINDVFSVYGLLGATHGNNHYKETDTGYYFAETVSQGSLSYGVGASANVSQKVAVNLEFAHLYTETHPDYPDVKYQALTLGANYKF